MITIALFSLIFGALGIGNDPAEEAFAYDEYQATGLLVGNLINTLRQSIGEFGMFGVATQSGAEENVMFWIVWLAVVFVLNIIFLNFIIAEAGASYNNVQELLDEFIWQSKAALIAEAEDMLPDFMKTDQKFPKYIISRDKDE